MSCLALSYSPIPPHRPLLGVPCPTLGASTSTAPVSLILIAVWVSLFFLPMRYARVSAPWYHVNLYALMIDGKETAMGLKLFTHKRTLYFVYAVCSSVDEIKSLWSSTFPVSCDSPNVRTRYQLQHHLQTWLFLRSFDKSMLLSAPSMTKRRYGLRVRRVEACWLRDVQIYAPLITFGAHSS